MTTTLPRFDPFAPNAQAHPGGALNGSPLAFGPAGYVVLGHDLAVTILRDQRFRNAALQLMEDFGITDGPVHQFRANSVIMAEGQRHIRLRSPLARFMGPTVVEDMRGALRAIVDDITTGLDINRPVDVHAEISRHIPARVYCHLAGAPVADAPLVARLSEQTLSLLSRDRSLIPTILAAYDELFTYLRGLIDRKRAAGLGDDMLSFLVAQHDAGKLSAEELLNEATAMLEASSVNTTHQTSLVVWTLLRERAAWRQIVADPSLIPAAVVEAIRLYPRPGTVSKIANEDVHLAGVTIPAGADVHIAIWSANRDPECFEHPDTFTLGRARNQPLTFSTGAHGCLGQSLARLEMEEVVSFLAEHHADAVVLDDRTELGQAGGRWLVKSLTVDLKLDQTRKGT